MRGLHTTQASEDAVEARVALAQMLWDCAESQVCSPEEPEESAIAANSCVVAVPGPG
jgi:hypothetical protein